MQRFCEACHAVFSEGEVCPLCRKRHVRDVREDDLCFFSEQTGLMATIIEDILQQEGLRFIMRHVYGAGISAVTGQMLDSVRFYTPYSDYEKACELMDTMFPEDTDPIEGTN